MICILGAGKTSLPAGSSCLSLSGYYPAGFLYIGKNWFFFFVVLKQKGIFVLLKNVIVKRESFIKIILQPHCFMWRRKHHQNKSDLCMRHRSVVWDVNTSWSADVSELWEEMLKHCPWNSDQRVSTRFLRLFRHLFLSVEVSSWINWTWINIGKLLVSYSVGVEVCANW